MRLGGFVGVYNRMMGLSTYQMVLEVEQVVLVASSAHPSCRIVAADRKMVHELLVVSSVRQDRIAPC